jgi:hypothetical protein
MENLKNLAIVESDCADNRPTKQCKLDTEVNKMENHEHEPTQLQVSTSSSIIERVPVNEMLVNGQIVVIATALLRGMIDVPFRLVQSEKVKTLSTHPKIRFINEFKLEYVSRDDIETKRTFVENMVKRCNDNKLPKEYMEVEEKFEKKMQYITKTFSIFSYYYQKDGDDNRNEEDSTRNNKKIDILWSISHPYLGANQDDYIWYDIYINPCMKSDDSCRSFHTSTFSQRQTVSCSLHNNITYFTESDLLHLTQILSLSLSLSSLSSSLSATITTPTCSISSTSSTSSTEESLSVKIVKCIYSYLNYSSVEELPLKGHSFTLFTHAQYQFKLLSFA